MTSDRFLYIFTLLSAGYVAVMVAFCCFGLVATAVATALYVASITSFSKCMETGNRCRPCLAGAVLVSSIIAFLIVLHATRLALP